MEPATIAIDLGKRVFQIHFVDPNCTIHSKALKRVQMLPFFADRPASRVVMEACGSTRHRAPGPGTARPRRAAHRSSVRAAAREVEQE